MESITYMVAIRKRITALVLFYGGMALIRKDINAAIGEGKDFQGIHRYADTSEDARGAAKFVSLPWDEAR